MASKIAGKSLALALMASLAIACPAAAQTSADGLVVKRSDFGVTKTLDRLGLVLERAGITIFARIRHASNARKAGLQLRPMEVLIFGNARLGTPLMRSNPAIGLDLPLRALAWEDVEGTTYLAYTAPATLRERYGIDDRDQVFDKMTGALAKFSDMAVTRGAVPDR